MFELSNTNPNNSLTTAANATAPTNILNSQIMPRVFQDLQRFATDPNVNEKLKFSFGSDYNVQTAQTILANWVIGNFSNIPSIELVERGDIAGANGAFGAVTKKIYVSKDILTGELINTQAVEDVILEEIGHSVDAQINTVDAPGDEGAIFAATVQGRPLSSEELATLKAENDTAVVIMGGKPIVIEQNTMSNPQTINNATGYFTGRQLYLYQSVSTNNDQYYRFTIEQPGGRLSVGLKDLSGSADVYLIRDANNNGRVDSGEVLASSEGSSNKLISGNQLDNLAAGTYYVRVKGNASYGIAVNLDQAGNTFSTARPLGDLTAKRRTYMDFLGASTGDDVDYYQFSINGPRKLQLALRTTDLSQENPEKNVTLELFDQNQRPVTLNKNIWDNGRYAQANLAAGMYYAKVTPINNNVAVNYRLVLNLLDQAPSFNITPSFQGNFTKDDKRIINNAIDYWKSKIISSPAGSNLEGGLTLNIYNKPQPAPTVFAAANQTDLEIYPYWTNYQNQTLKQQVIQHELGHALGFGTSNEFYKLVTPPPELKPPQFSYSEFTGANAKALYGNRNIPLQGSGDFSSTKNWNNRTTGYFHWTEKDFPQELMSAVTNDDKNNQINLTLAALKDMGFVLKA
ncbi:MAG: pre-peptidase C-terminal domain-containing protein [Actinomycetota bacterium]